MKLKDLTFSWRCANPICEYLMCGSSKLSEVKEEFKCPGCGKINKYHFGKIVFKVKK